MEDFQEILRLIEQQDFVARPINPSQYKSKSRVIVFSCGVVQASSNHKTLLSFEPLQK